MLKSKHSLPSAWDQRPTDVHRLSLQALSFLEVDGLRIRYKARGLDDSEAASIRTNHHVPADVPVYYYEVDIISKGREGFIGIGFSTPDFPLNNLPGWKPKSWGYHGDDGHRFEGSSSGRGEDYGPTYTTGDWIGVIWDRLQGTISYTKNGSDLGIAFRGVFEQRLYPTIGFRTPGETVVTNFGLDSQKPFRGDYSALLHSAQEQVRQNILHSFVPGSCTLEQLILDYLIYNCCWRTAAVFARDALPSDTMRASAVSDVAESSGVDDNGDDDDRDVSMTLDDDVSAAASTAPTPESASVHMHNGGTESGGGLPSWRLEAELEASQQRQAVCDAVRSGRIEDAVAMTHALVPDCLTRNESIAFQLQVQQLVEIIREGAQRGGSRDDVDDKAIEFGRRVLAAHKPCSAADTELLKEALSLLAYDCPESSPASHLLALEHRSALAEQLNGVILAHQGRQPQSALETVLRHAHAVHAALADIDDPHSALFSVSGIAEHGIHGPH